MIVGVVLVLEHRNFTAAIGKQAKEVDDLRIIGRTFRQMSRENCIPCGDKESRARDNL